jgi:hypothetical protein
VGRARREGGEEECSQSRDADERALALGAVDVLLFDHPSSCSSPTHSSTPVSIHGRKTGANQSSPPRGLPAVFCAGRRARRCDYPPFGSLMSTRYNQRP